MTTSTIDTANELLRKAVQQRRESQAAGRPHEEWYATMQAKGGATAQDIVERFGNVSQPVTEPMPEVAEAEESQHVDRQGSTPFLALLDEIRALHISKSQDYGSEEDPLANIRQGAEFVGIEAWRGCMVRVADKVQRMRTYCRTGRLVHEGVRDTLLDLAAYSLLAVVLFDEDKE